MLIGIDASRATVDQRTGTEGYSLHIIRSLLEQASPDIRFRLYFREQPDDNLFPMGNSVEQRVITRKRLWTHVGLRQELRRDPPDVLFVPAHVIPWPTPAGVPSVVTAHDLGYLHYPDKHPLLARLYLNWSTRHSTNIARRVIAVSNATAHDLMALNGVPQEKIRVVHSGVDDILSPVRDDQLLSGVKQRYGIDGPYVLHVGSLQPRKNLRRLVEAYARVREKIDSLKLVLAGRPGWDYEPLYEQIDELGLNEHVLLPGYVPDDDLAALYSAAEAYAFPSLYEGFGFPALEAMRCGTALICANTSSLPELVGDAALSFAPTDVDGIAEALLSVLTDPALKQDLERRGIERAKVFTWESAARKTMEILREAGEI